MIESDPKKNKEITSLLIKKKNADAERKVWAIASEVQDLFLITQKFIYLVNIAYSFYNKKKCGKEA